MKKLIIILTIQALFVGPFASAEDSMAAIDLERLKSKIALIESHFASQMASAGICGEYLKSRRIDATGVSSSLNDLISSKKIRQMRNFLRQLFKFLPRWNS